MFDIPVILIFILKSLIDGQETPEGCELFTAHCLLSKDCQSRAVPLLITSAWAPLLLQSLILIKLKSDELIRFNIGRSFGVSDMTGALNAFSEIY